MKKKLILLLIPVLILSLLCGCNKGGEPVSPLNVMYEAKHQRDEISSRIFNVFKMETENAFYEIENKEDIDAVSAESIINDIENIVKKIITYKKELFVTKPTIIITQYDIKTGLDFEEAYYKNNTVVAKFEMLDTYDLTSCIIGAVSGIVDHWLLYGIAGSVMEVSTDMNQLQTYYSNPDNLRTLDFFGMRFMNAFNGEDTSYTKETAIALYKYIENKYGFDSIVSLDPQIQINVTKDMKNEWLKSIGVTHIYDSMYDGLFNGYRFTNKIDYDIGVISSFAEYYIVMQEDEEFLLTSIDNLELFLYQNLMGVAELKERLSISSYYNKLNTDEKIIYLIDESKREVTAYVNPSNGIVHLNAPGFEAAHIHETVHVFFIDYLKQHNTLLTYLQEGLACYLSNTGNNTYSYLINHVNNEPYCKEHIYVTKIYTGGCNGETLKGLYENPQVLEKNFMDYFIDQGGKIESLEDCSLSLYADAQSYALLKTYGDNVEHAKSYSIYESYVTYLVNNYSLDHVIGANIDCESFEEIFGKSHEIMFDEWKEYILSN
ncbi:MAG: hypothetical protein PHV04_05620 [Clostridia bacterium]|nr:hypothetical protein [Clostridia bacterium]